MKKWYEEDWRFTIQVERVGKKDSPQECRLGLEVGDMFECEYGCPADFCPISFINIFPAMEVVRCNGDLQYLGAGDPHEIKFLCPDGVVWFRLRGEEKGG